ncbi:hypothetical protein [Blastococcus haudaquaticus]|uniref:Uncharacterized protein n=1 Tax=Blastococcus haudaquaticus TaxID=1938745 RepID=A0A286GUY2_9ACTN|nr:hypothetical protein [Blastococcus haudaquaticus]SOD99377.1 hypothetical protein SAMN06272739_2282 [Blastococcus haudaquaticus]
MNEDELRDLLHGAAGRGGTALLDHDAAVDAVVRTAAVHRRRRSVFLVAAACLALIAVVLPAVWPSGRAAPDVDVAQAQAAVLDWPTRGSLADDPSALDAVRRLAWTTPSAAPAVEDRQVAFLGDVEGSRRALVLGRGPVDDQVAGQWFTGPVGADPAALVADGPAERLDDAASSAHVPAPGDVLLVLVTPGDGVELSPRVEVGADGSVRRDFTPLTVTDGVALTSVGRPTVHGSSGLYRVVRDGGVVESRPVPVSFATEFVWSPPVLTPLDPDSEPPVPEAVDLALEGVLAQTGLTREQVQLDLLFSGALPQDAGDGTVDGVVLAVTLPDGAVVVSLSWADMQTSGSGSAGSCGMQAHPAGTDLATVAVAAECRLQGPDGGGEPLLVLYGPGTLDRLEVSDRNGTVAVEIGEVGGFVTARPAPVDGVLRSFIAGQQFTEQAVIGVRQDEIVTLGGRGAD